jgi:uncharacterized membrane protein
VRFRAAAAADARPGGAFAEEARGCAGTTDAPLPVMYSKARIAGHPLHPMLVVFPVAFYTATAAALFTYALTSDAFYYRAAMVANVAGVVLALAAMIPGAIDLFSLPRESRARTKGLSHAGHALATTAVFAANAGVLIRGWVGRVMVDGRWDLGVTLPLSLAVIGLVLVVMTAVAGYALVQTHHLGIKPALVHPHRPSREPELDEAEKVVTPIDRAKSAHVHLHVVRP